FAKFRFGSLINAEDFADKVNYQWTGAFLIISTALIAMRQYIFTPIQCWVPPEWPRPWEEYTENFCWIQNTYHVVFYDPSHPNPEGRKKAELNYYQWVPFVLALESLLVYSPHLVWKLVTVQSGYNPNAIVKFAAEAATIDQDKKRKLIGYLARHVEKAMNSRRQWRLTPSCYSNLQRLCYTVLPCFWFGKRSGTMLFALYITNKAVYALMAFAHLYVMKCFLGFDSLAFGWHCLNDLLQGREWQQTRVFPRVTFCDVPAKYVGQWNIRSVQCVLPVNLLNEKIYIFLWFWTILCLILTGLSTALWVGRLLIYKNRQSFVKKYLRILNSIISDDTRQEDKGTRKRFVNEFLAHDGIFILRMIAENVGDVCVADVVDEMYKNYVNALIRAAADDAASVVGPPPLQRTASTASTTLQRRVSALGPQEEQIFPFGKKSIV
uniref:Innexin n=1 Tax=Macrostomum lignano TaxID=282301 RepID=A0A1I8G301_9PLAT